MTINSFTFLLLLIYGIIFSYKGIDYLCHYHQFYVALLLQHKIISLYGA